MEYSLTWMNHWSSRHKPSDDRVIVRYTKEPDGWYEHESTLYFMVDSDEAARKYADHFISNYDEPIDVYSLIHRKSGAVIMTEEGAYERNIKGGRLQVH